MPLNINKYMKKKKRSCIDKIRLRYRLHQRWVKQRYKKVDNEKQAEKKQEKIRNKNFCEFFKKISLFVIKFIGWVILFCIGLLFHNEYTSKIPTGLIFGFYIAFIFGYYSCQENIKSLKLSSEINQFDKEFLKLYNPVGLYIVSFLLIFISSNYVDIHFYILLNFFPCIYDGYERRYLTLYIEQHMIYEEQREKFNLINKKLDTILTDIEIKKLPELKQKLLNLISNNQQDY